MLSSETKKFRRACEDVTEHAYGPKGLWSYTAFDFINEHYFDGRLPTPLILWELTAHGGCLAWAAARAHDSGSPIINLHPTLLGGQAKKRPWGIPAYWLGESFAFDTLLHECMHIHIGRNLGGTKGSTSHNCDNWVAEVNRISVMLKFRDIIAGRSKVVRVEDPSGEKSIRGKPATLVKRRPVGNIPFVAVAGFPYGLRDQLGVAASHYTTGKLPSGMPRLK